MPEARLAAFDEWWVEIIENTVAHPRGELRIAWVGNGAVWMLFGRVERECTMSEGATWVAPVFLRTGVGLGLMQACVERGRGCGGSTVWLWAKEKNTQAVAFYERGVQTH